MKAFQNTEKLERLSQKEIVRFFMHVITEMKLNPKKFEESIDIESVLINDTDFLMTRVEIKLLNRFNGRGFLYTDYHARDYCCSNQSLSPIKI